ncbi:unnamed protein product [Cladocopium goreaui]|uniref:C3H1-type domain-containing protein n=1 Tax=Cladocopium goreaui TaxID=2562237 RepID=A0A9P1BU12_9DINO|nr:unnamed protein product [Cladocopium goreaui]
MASQSLEDIMSTCGVDPTIASQLVQDGWTTQSFACAALDLESFDRLWQDLFADTELSLLQKASVRAAFKMCQSALQSVAAPSAPSSASASGDPMTSQNSWAESFPPKLDSSVIDQLKAKFLASYPSELVNHDTMPSTRLLSLVHHQLLKKQWAWIPWKYRLTMAKADEISSQRQTKMPKLELASLHNLLVDEPPSIDISNSGFGVNAVRNLLAVHDMAVAMCGGAHLANLKAYSAKFLGFLTQKVDPETMLRCASITEAQAADRQICAAIADLMAERNWDMDNCLHEFTHIRHDLPGLLQLRPRPAKAQSSSQPWTEPEVQEVAMATGSTTPAPAATVAYGAASPSCAHYSRLKLHRPGPKALRTPEAMQGVPGLTSEYLSRQTACYPEDLATAFAERVADEPPLSAHLTNWQSADDDIMLTRMHNSDIRWALRWANLALPMQMGDLHDWS